MTSRWIIALATGVFVLSCQLLSGGADLKVGTPNPQGGGGPSGGGGQGAAAGTGGSTGGAGGTGGGIQLPPPCVDGAIGALLLGGESRLSVHDISPTTDGGCLVAGDFDGDLPQLGLVGETAQSEAFVLRFSAGGTLEETRILDRDGDGGVARYESAHHIRLDDDDAVVAGQSANGGFVATLDGDGIGWWAELTGSPLQINDVVVDGSDIWIAGVCGGPVTYDDSDTGAPTTFMTCGASNSIDGFAMRISTTSATTFDRQYRFSGPPNSPGVASVRSIALDGDSLALVGHFASNSLVVGYGTESSAPLTPGLSGSVSGFLAVADVDGSGAGGGGGGGSYPEPQVTLVESNDEARATAVTFLDPTKLAIGGQFATDMYVGSMSASADAEHGFIAAYNLSGGVLAPAGGTLVHLAEGDDSAEVIVQRILPNPADGNSVLVAGKIRGTLVSDLVSAGLHPFVIRAALDTNSPSLKTLLHIEAESTDPLFGLGMQLDGANSLFVAAEIVGPGQIGEELPLETLNDETHGLIVTLPFSAN